MLEGESFDFYNLQKLLSGDSIEGYTQYDNIGWWRYMKG